MADAQRGESSPGCAMHMEDVLSYIVHSNHHVFTDMLIANSVANVRQCYPGYDNLQQMFSKVLDLIREPGFSYKHKVVIFFFLLSIDRKMRHWILQSQQSKQYAEIQANTLKKNIEMSPHYGASRSAPVKNPFLGQNVCFRALLPAKAVPILLSISDESFFEDIVIQDQNPEAMDEAFVKIQQLVLLS